MRDGTPLRALVADDEAVARLAITRRLESLTKDIVICGEARNGDETIEMCRRLTPDVLFLDISMPGKNGFEVARRLAGDDAPLIVFLTAYGDRALEAFETEAIDYLMKPVAPERLTRTIKRICDEFEKRLQLKRSQQQPGDSIAEVRRKTLNLDIGDGIVCVCEDDISYVEAAGEYACVHAATETHVVRLSLKYLEEKMLSERFYRIHRKTIVNLAHVERLIAKGAGEQAVRLHGGEELAVSRRRLAGLRAMLSSP